MKRAPVIAIVAAVFLTANASAQDLPTRALQRFGSAKLRHGSRILCLAYAPDGNTLVGGGGNDPVRLWNPKTGDLLRELGEPWVHALAFSPSGETLLYGGYSKVVRLWNFRLNKETGRLEGHKAAIKAIAVAPDASLIATGSQDGVVALWEMNTKSKWRDLPGHTDEVNALVYFTDKDGNGLLASAGSDRTIIVWNTSADPPTVKHKIDAGAGVFALAASEDGKTLYSAGDDHLMRRWDATTGKPAGTFKGHDGAVVSLFLQRDTLISASLDRTVRIWDINTNKQIRALPLAPGDAEALAVSRNGVFLATGGTNNTIRIFEAANLKEISFGPGVSSGLVSSVLSPDDRRLACATADGQIVVWDAQAGTLLKQWNAKQSADVLLAFAPDSKTLVSASNVVRIWDTERAVEIARLPTQANHVVLALAFSPDGKTLGLGHHGGEINLWDVKGKKSAGAFRYAGALQAIAWSPDGKKLAAAGGAKVLVWDVSTGDLVKSFDVKEGPVTFPILVASLAFGPDSKTLAAGGWDSIIRIYNLAAKNPTAAHSVRLCTGHHSAVHAVAFSHDGRCLVSGSFDRSCRLWEAFSGKQIALFKGHVGEVRGVAFARDGRSVFSGGSDTVGYQWNVPDLLPNGKLPDLTLTVGELDEAWTTLLTEDTALGHKTMWECIASGKQAAPHFSKKIDACLIDPARVKKLFRDLDSTQFSTRMLAMTELPKFGRWMEGRLDAAIVDPPSLEYKRRAEMLKEKLNVTNSPPLAQERMRIRRVMLMCEQVGGPDAVTALRKLAERGPEEDIREEAELSLRRMKK